MDRPDLRDAYLAQLNPRERGAYQIAKDMLGTSFDLFRSKGFLKWLKTVEPKPK